MNYYSLGKLCCLCSFISTKPFFSINSWNPHNAKLRQVAFDCRFYHYLLVDTMAGTAVFLYQLFHSLLLADDGVEKHSTFTLIKW